MRPIAYRPETLNLSDHERYFNVGWNALLRRLEDMGFTLPDEPRYELTEARRALLDGAK